MINPIVNAANFFVGMYELLPFSIKAVIGLSLGQFALVAVIETFVNHMR